MSLAHNRMLRAIRRDRFHYPPDAHRRAQRERLLRDPRVVKVKASRLQWWGQDNFYRFPPSWRQREAAARKPMSITLSRPLAKGEVISVTITRTI